MRREVLIYLTLSSLIASVENNETTLTLFYGPM